MSKVIIGVDVGLKGALAVYDGEELLIFDMPVFEIERGEKNRKVVDINGLVKIVKDNGACCHAYLERVWAQPSNGAASAFSYGYGAGVVEAVFTCCNVPLTFINPKAWKKAMGCTKDKDGSRRRASQLLPQFSDNWTRKKDHDRAEAALIALYGWNQ